MVSTPPPIKNSPPPSAACNISLSSSAPAASKMPGSTPAHSSPVTCPSGSPPAKSIRSSSPTAIWSAMETSTNEAGGLPRDTLLFPKPWGNGRWSQELYYHLLNCGLRIPPTAGSGSGANNNPVGYNRFYVNISNPSATQRNYSTDPSADSASIASANDSKQDKPDAENPMTWDSLVGSPPCRPRDRHQRPANSPLRARPAPRLRLQKRRRPTNRARNRPHTLHPRQNPLHGRDPKRQTRLQRQPRRIQSRRRQTSRQSNSQRAAGSSSALSPKTPTPTATPPLLPTTSKSATNPTSAAKAPNSSWTGRTGARMKFTKPSTPQLAI